MIRYRCPHCAAVIVAHERRVGQSSVCKACVKPHAIPVDQAQWLNEFGELLHSPAPPAPEPVLVIEPVASADPVPALPVIGEAAASAGAPSVPDFHLADPIPTELERIEVPEPRSVPVVVEAREPDPDPAPDDIPDLDQIAPPAPRPPRLAPRAAAEHPEAFDSRPGSGVVTLTPPPAPAPDLAASRPRPLPLPAAGHLTPAPAPSRSSGERAEPVQLQTQADIAAALTAALTNRMKPPAAPRRDLRPSTAAWMLLTALGVSLVVLALFTDTDYRWGVLLVGAVQVVAGYGWIVRLTRFRDRTRGLVCAIPPLTLFYLAQYKYAKYRPLRFVVTGAALVALGATAPGLAPHTRALVRRTDPPIVTPDPATLSKLEQLRIYRDQRSYDALSKVLDVLAKTDPLLSEDAPDRAVLSAELKGLCDHPDTGVKVRAMAAYARWDPNGARAVCLAAVRSPTWEEREWALRLLPQWKDADSARAVQSLIGRPGTVESNRAKAALEEIGGVAAEQAAIALLNRAEDQGTKLTALSVLEKVAGLDTAAWLKSSYAAAADDPAVRDRALVASDAIKARVRVEGPRP